ncbi:MAG: hypothetical protein HQL80_04165 [Magnetococcales bacterium]|nr:hypothetical protein [Magnetococcales bacterium]
MDSTFHDNNEIFSRIIDTLSIIVSFVFVVFLWPIGFYVWVNDLFQDKKRALVKKHEFAVNREHLQERLTVQEVEMREVVTDPLKAVPELPFGHLNAAWQAFINAHADGGELWSFSAWWQTTWGQKELRSGYVVVKDGKPSEYFLTVWKDIQDEAQD